MPDLETIPEQIAEPIEPPRLLVEWSSPWEEFTSSLRPAFTRSPKRLAGEAPVGMFPYRGMLGGMAVEVLLILALIELPLHLITFELPLPPNHPQQDVIYYSGDELPQTQDSGGARSGKTGRAGGQQAHHRTQTIRVARGDRPSEKVADAPKLNLPSSDAAVANLLAFQSTPGPPPSEGLRSKLTAPVLPEMAAVAPAPDVNSSSRRASVLSSDVVAPAPDVSRTEVSRTSDRTKPNLSSATTVVAPTPNVSREKLRSASPVGPTVVAPAPTDAPRDIASSRVPLTPTVSVVAPSVSAPQRDTASRSKLSLPTPAVVAPPPSQVSRDLNSWGRTNSGNTQTNPVPPPPSAPAAGSNSRNTANLSTQVIPPPASLDAGTQSGGSNHGGSQSSVGSLVGTANVVPPPPGLGGGKALSGNGRGNKGNGAGSPLDLGQSVAPPQSGGNAPGTAVIASSKPGPTVGKPNSTNGGALAMSPTGTEKSGLGGNGGGAGIGKGNGPGSGMLGENSGAGREGAGRGSDPNARAGISPYPGPGGTGSGSNGTPAVPGVSVEGGTTTITLPSFGDPGGSSPSSGPGRSSANPYKRSGITIEATPSSGGVFACYNCLKGDRQYSIYIETSLGTAVMQYADPASATHASSENLSPPEPMRKDLPEGLRPTRVVFVCTIDQSGDIKDLRVSEPGAAETTSKIAVALHKWKFRPAFRGNDPVEITAILGFGVDTH